MSEFKTRIKPSESSQVESETIKVLLIEDNPGDARLVKEMLLEAGAHRFSLKHGSCIREGLALLSQGGTRLFFWTCPCRTARVWIPFIKSVQPLLDYL